jgi:glycosyltransferase involved in cell wall biosynthesis
MTILTAMYTPCRLLIVAEPLSGGVARHVVDLVTGLDPTRFSVEVACPTASLMWHELKNRNVQLHSIPDGTWLSCGDARAWWMLIKLIRRADVVHAHSSKAGFLVRTAAFVSGRTKSCVFTPHAWSFWAFDGRKRRLFEAVERRTAKWCHTIITVSGFERDEGLKRGIGQADQYRLIYNGVAIQQFASRRESTRADVLVVGRLAEQKRPELAVRALAHLLRLKPQARLLFAGDGPLREAVERLAAELGVGESVRILGHRDDIPALLTGAACLLLTSSYEGCPISVLEGMAAGLPVVAVASGGLDEIISDRRTGLLVEADPRSISAGLLAVLAQPSLAEDIGAAARATAHRRYSIGRMVAETAQVYNDMSSIRQHQ